MSFWISLLLINIIMFLPLYVLNFKVQPNPLHVLMSKETTIGKLIKIPYAKISSDPFKIFFEFTALILILRYLSIQSAGAIIGCTILALLGWMLIIYAGVMHYVFYRPPAFKSDWQLIQVGHKMVYSQRYALYTGVVGLIVVMTLICIYFSNVLLTASVDVNYIPWVLLAITPLALIKSHRMTYEKIINKTVLSVGMYAYRIWKKSSEYYFPIHRDLQYFESKSPCQKLNLTERPNLSIICVESYGEVAFQEPDYYKYLEPVLHKYRRRLAEKGYHICSGMSHAPLIGGGSWKCYSTLMYGIKIDDDALYNMMFKDVDAFEGYKSLFHLLSESGYTNYLLCPLGEYEEGAVDWELLKRNVRSDIYLEYPNMEYKGKPLEFFGNTKCPPDQYSMGKASEILKQQHNDPYFLFFISLNSHYPFLSPTKVVDDWKSLNDPKLDIEVLTKNTDKQGVRYAKSMAYQLETCLKHIEDTEEALYVLVGDHQPPRTKLVNNSRRTPIHIIAKNKEVLEPFASQGFKDGLIPDLDDANSINHEGFLSLFLNGIQRAYSKPGTERVAYQPHGVRFNKDDI